MIQHFKKGRALGFTIVELLIVIVVIGILASLVVVAYNGVASGARDKAVISDMDGVEAELVRYQTKNSGADISGLSWYSPGTANPNIKFKVTNGNIVDVVANATDYCIRIYNPSSTTYKNLDTAFTKGSGPGACDSLVASSQAQAGDGSSSNVNYAWTERTGSGSRNWRDVTISNNGERLTAIVENGYIYTSSDSGATWTARTSAGSRNWRYLAASSDGKNLIATVYSGFIYTSNNYGETWTAGTQSGQWATVASSSDGSIAIANQEYGSTYISVNSGVTWTVTSLNFGTADVAISSSGTVMTALDRSAARVFVSTNTGSTWTQRTTPSTSMWSVASSSDGTKLFIGGGLNCYNSTNSGVAWNNRAGFADQTSVTCGSLDSSSDGSKVIASASGNNYVVVSPDFGAQWIMQDVPAGNYLAVTMNDSGSKAAVARYGGSIYTANR